MSGDRLTVPARSRHSFEMRSFFEESAALGRGGRFKAPGVPRGLGGLLAGAELLDRYRDIIVVTSPPPALQRIVNPVLARLERRRRKRSR